jgi:hypothetical protein
MTPATYTARRVAKAIAEQARCRDHLLHQLEQRRPVSALAREAEGLYRAYRRTYFQDLGVPAEKVAWLIAALVIRSILQPADP